MFLIEIACPAGALADGDRVALTKSISSALLLRQDTAEETMRRARAMTHLAFRELTGWATGDGPLSPEAAPPLWVTVTVPEQWRNDVAGHVIGYVRAAVRRVDRRHGWRRTGGDLWINVVGIADGCIGLDGRAATADDVLDHMTEEFRAALDTGREVPDGQPVDPICGMRTSQGPRAIIVEHNGTIVSFCSDGCRAAYRRQHGLAASPEPAAEAMSPTARR